MEVLRLENLSKYYTSASGVVMGLSGVSLSFSVGEFVAVTGESGSGKSTMAHVLGGMLPYESGEMYVCGKPTSHYDAADWERYRRDMIGFISQNYGILNGNTVLENVSVALRLGGMDKKAANTRARQLLRKVELDGFCTRRAAKLSSGQKQRLAIARALAKPCRILIADEPTGNLDRENSDKVISLLKQVSQDRLVIMITHEFDEVREVATRHVVLSDATVISDASLSPSAACKQGMPAHSPENFKKQRLTPYIAGLTLKARPAFSAILCLLLAFTSFISFALLGTFTVALDDTPTKIYTPDAFYNGDPTRIVIMKSGGEHFTPEELDEILTLKHTSSIERWGYTNDCSYYYRPEVDYQLYTDIINGPNYHPLLNPDDFQVTNAVKFIENDLYFRTVPLTAEPLSYTGRLPSDVYEVLSADPAHKLGDVVRVYIRNRAEWSVSGYVYADFTVVGKTEQGQGLYFSDSMAAALSHASTKATYAHALILNRSAMVMILPYQPGTHAVTSYFKSEGEQIGDTPGMGKDGSIIPGYFPTPEGTIGTPEDGVIALGENEICLPEHMAGAVQMQLGTLGRLDTMIKDGEFVRLKGLYNATYSRLALVSPALFDRMTDTTPDNQISLYLTDYSYADRIMDKLDDKGYLSISPFRLGSSLTDAALARERQTTLIICLCALLLVFVLQVVLIKAMFSSLHEHFRLLSAIGLRSGNAFGSLCCLLLLFTAIGEVLAAICIVLLNLVGQPHVVSIFKYLESGSIALIFGAHLLSILPAFAVAVRAMQKSVFASSGQAQDLDLSQTEDA